MIEDKKINNLMNEVKAIACFLVVFIHVKFPGVAGDVMYRAGSFAVPFFYLIAGYYSYKKDYHVIKKRLSKIIRIFIFAYICYFIFYLSLSIYHSNLDQWIIQNFNIFALIESIFFCTIPFAPTLWYLIAMIETYIFWLVLLKKDKHEIVFKVIPLLFLLQLVSTIYFETANSAWFLKMNFITKSLPWFLLGNYIHNHQDYIITKFSNRFLFIFLIIGFIISYVPDLFNLYIKFGCIGHIPYAVSIFILVIKYPTVRLFPFLEYIGKRLSLFVYIYHVLIYYILVFVFNNLIIIDFNSLSFQFVLPILTLIVSLLLYYMSYLLMRKIDFNF